MIALFRLLLLGVFLVLVSVLGCLYCLLRPFHPDHVYRFAHLFGALAPWLGVKVEMDGLENVPKGPAVYISNHQSSWDLVTASNAVRHRTVTIGKKSLKWIPFFGQLYWLTGNILIDRKNSARAKGTIDEAARRIREEKLSVWIFPEGTRSYGRGLLPFKTGAFHTAITAGVPLVPIAVSSLEKMSLNRWNNGTVRIRFLPPIDTSKMERGAARELSLHCHGLMEKAITELSGQQ
ncbi:1-acylglycerol-3-phosphate O-acyltransferase [Gallaecimonas kandeliae]|uniref:1-acylglycerol-3-phosphate O-acyltransferase n=1 Tax=Gallaecimonas kandeliae TaxID=3029055 RepID=UPI0026498D2B|nr:1-acylglycerol-3-phosphate O-acyltransferase [Gallaecimonas kandeliae]WKE64734.1 1-acylglycerol-3-phosphate O-acyltransferase [Gallaecimonas kandeliae]